jgi:hypothetical protein
MTWIAKAFDIGLSVALGAGIEGRTPLDAFRAVRLWSFLSNRRRDFFGGSRRQRRFDGFALRLWIAVSRLRRGRGRALAAGLGFRRLV